jgi:predicted RND superfamily exporter protein
MQVEFAGGHRVAVETEALVRRESILNTIGSLAVILPLLFVVFRSMWLVAVGALPATLALLLVLGAFGFLGVRLSAAGTGAAAMLFGLGIDGVVLLYVAYLLPHSSTDTDDTASRISEPSTSMLLGMWTTAATFYGLAVVDFPSLQQLGLLIGHSMVLCGVLTLLLVPALLPKRAPRGNTRWLIVPALAPWIRAYRRAILATTVVLTLVLGLSVTRLRVNPSLEQLRSVTSAAELEARIGSAFGLPTTPYVVLADGTNLDALLETNEQLARRITSELPKVRLQAPTWLLPSPAAQARATDQIARSGLTSANVREFLERAAEANGFRPGVFEPFADRLPDLLDRTQRLSYNDYAEHGLGDFIGRFVVHSEGVWRLATYVFPSTDDEIAQLQTIVDRVDESQILTGLPLVNKEISRTFVREFVKGLSAGSILVVLLVVSAFRDLRLSLFALLPTLIGLAWTGGILGLAGIELDLFAAFAVVTLLGIGVDYGVHLVHRYHERGDAAKATSELAPVILVAAAITILGYGTLVTSSYPPLRSIGIVSVVSVVTLAVASVLVLPALLLSPNDHD